MKNSKKFNYAEFYQLHDCGLLTDDDIIVTESNVQACYPVKF